MRLQAFETTRLQLPMRIPLRTSHETYTVREGTCLAVRSGDRVGWGEATPIEAHGTESLERSRTCLRALPAQLVGHRLPDSPSGLEAMLHRVPTLASCPAARHALECALLDLLAQTRRQPVARLLNARSRSTVKVNALLAETDPSKLAAEGAEATAAGFGAVKVKVGADPIELDLARLQALRARVGPSIRIRADANGAWRSEAAARLRSLAVAHPEICEQPVPATEVESLRRLRGATTCLIAADEAISSFDAGLRLIEGPKPAVDLLALRPMVLGGILPALRLARAARIRRIGCYVVSSLDGAIARAAATHLAAALPQGLWASGLGVGHLFEGRFGDHLYRPIRGRIRIPDGAGLALGEWSS